MMPKGILRRAGARLWQARKGATALAGWAGLYLILFLLLALALVEGVTRPAGDAVRLEDPEAPFDASSVVIGGRAKPWTPLKLEVDGRFDDFTTADEAGLFTFYPQLPAAAKRLRVVAFSRYGKELGAAERQVRWAPGSFEPRLDLCLVSESLAWIVGRGTPGDSLGLLAEPALPAGNRVRVDESGIFDLLLPLDGAAPERLTLVGDLPDASAASVGCRVLEPEEPFPASRETVIEIGADVATLMEEARRREASGQSRASDELVAALLPRASVKVRLPAEHPAVRLLTEGSLPATALLEHAVGRLDGIPEPETVEPLKEALRRSPGIAEELDLEPRLRLWLSEGAATIEVDLYLFSFGPGSSLRLDAGSGGGIASRPLFTAADSFTVRAPPGDSWSFELPPTTLAPGAATWRGPLEVEEIVATRAVPLELFWAQGRTPGQPQAANMRDFLRALERIERSGVGRLLWQTLLALLPALASIWLLRRRQPYAGMVEASALLAFAALAALLLALPLIQSAIARGTSLFLGIFLHLIGIALSDLTLDGPPAGHLETVTSIGDLTREPFWLLVVLLVAAVPFYLDGWIRALSPGSKPAHGDPAPSSWWRTARTLLAVAWGGGILVVLWILSRPLTFFRAQDPDADSATVELLRLAYGVFPDGPLPPGFLPLALAAVLPVCAGWRGLLFAGPYASALFLMLDRRSWSETPVDPWLGLALLVAVGAASVPISRRLLQVAIPVAWKGRGPTLAAAGLAVAALGLHAMPAKMVLTAGSALLALGLLWAALSAYGALTATGGPISWLAARPRVSALLLLAVGAVLGWPLAAPDQSLRALDIASMLDQWRRVLPALLAVGLALVVQRRILSTKRRLLEPAELLAGTIFYAFFLVGSTSTLAFVPVPLLVALGLAASWLYIHESRQQELLDMDQVPAIDVPRIARAFLELAAPRARASAALAALRKRVEKATIDPEEYEREAVRYRRMGAGSGSADRARMAFALGDRDLAATLGAFVRTGLIIATVPIVISLYEYLPASRVAYPFPIADFLTFLVVAILKWGLYALFFGLFFANLRGESGLSKGVCLFFALAAPFTLYRLLGAASAEELRPFVFWVTQLFVFFGLLGVLSGDLRLLRMAGGGAGDLRTVHRLPALYGFASTVAAAILPTLLAAIAGKLGDVVTFFMEVVLPAASLGG